MAQTQLALYNLALSIAGSDFTIVTVTEESIPAATCELWYENVRQVVLRSAHWNSCKRHSRLFLESERVDSTDWTEDDPEPGYAYAYEVPTDFLTARYLTTFGLFSLSVIGGRRTISVNEESPILTYTADVTDPETWEPDLYQAMAYSLAAHITMPLTGKPSRVKQNLSAAYEFVLLARTNTANEMYQTLESRPEVLARRGYNFTPTGAPYIYPYGAFFAGTGAPTT